VENATGDGVSGARVVASEGYARADGVALEASGETLSGTDGTFELAFEVAVADFADVEAWRLQRVESAPITLFAQLDGWSCVGNVSVPLVSNGSRPEITILMGRSGSADVIVIDAATGLPIENATLTLVPRVSGDVEGPRRSARARTGAGGRCRFDRLAEGSYTIETKKLYYGARPAEGAVLTIDPATRVVHRVTLQGETGIFGSVVDAISGEPVPLATVVLRQEGCTSRRFRANGRGTFTPRVLVPRLTTIEVEAPGYLRVIREVFVDRERSREVIRLELTPNGDRADATPQPAMLRGTTVSDSTGTPVPFARITLTSPDGRVQRFKGDLEGRFSPLAWGKGTARLEVTARGFAPFAVEVTLDGEPGTRDLAPIRLVAVDTR